MLLDKETMSLTCIGRFRDRAYSDRPYFDRRHGEGTTVHAGHVTNETSGISSTGGSADVVVIDEAFEWWLRALNALVGLQRVCKPS